MSSNNEISFLKTIRFKLTLLYSLIFFLFCSVIVISLNVYMNSYLRTDPVFHGPPPEIKLQFENGTEAQFKFEDLQKEERMRIRMVRLEDLKKFQEFSIVSIAPIAVLSFVIGYILSGRFLNPINDLRRKINKIKTRNLGETIEVKSEDEVGSLIKSFNEFSIRLKESFDAQERFVQDASHELKTPLTVIQTNLDTLVDDDTATKEELHDAMKTALVGMKNVRDLTNRLLDLASPMKFDLKKVSLNSLIKKQADMLKEYADQRSVEFNIALPAEDIEINADEFYLSRAVFNIVQNAIKYSAEKDPKVEISIEKTKAGAVIKIRDNGNGIPPEHGEKIFERFYRIDNSRSRGSGGFGLGLAIAKKIIDDHGGTLKFTSEKGKTEFEIGIRI